MTIIGLGISAQHKERVVSVTHPNFAPSDPKQLELLKISAQIYLDYAATAEKLVRARARENWKFLRMHLAAVAGIGAGLTLYLKLSIVPPRVEVLTFCAIALMVLLLVNATWVLTILAVTRQAALKYRVIEALEHVLPVHPHTAEWDLAGRGEDLTTFLPRWMVELGLPIVISLVWFFAYGALWLA